MSLNDLPRPRWCDDLPDEHARLRFLFMLAAIYHNHEGSLRTLASAIGRSGAFFTMAAKEGKISGDDAVKIERAIGREIFPRELFRPDLFDAA